TGSGSRAIRLRRSGLRGLDPAGIESRELGDAPRQRREFHLLEERDQVFVFGLMHREVGERDFKLYLVVERDQLLRDPRHLGVVDQRLPALLLLDLTGAREQRFEIAELL